MAKIFYSTGINKEDVVVCAANISTVSKSAEIGKKYSTMKDNIRKYHKLDEYDRSLQ